MADTVTWQLLRGLAEFRPGRGCALSIYFRLDPREVPTQREILSRITSLLDEARRKGESMGSQLSHDELAALRADLGRVRDWFETEFDRSGVRGAAVFPARLDNSFRPLPGCGPVAHGV